MVFSPPLPRASDGGPMWGRIGLRVTHSLGLSPGREEEASGRCSWGGRRRGRRSPHFIPWGQV